MEKIGKGAMLEGNVSTSSSFKLHRIMIAMIFLTVSFLGIVTWFDSADIYHQHFFNAGLAILLYNFLRIAFGFLLFWIIYATGYAVISVAIPFNKHQPFTVTERIILGFGTGIGVWHILMLLLGILNLYYQSILIGLCLMVLILSANHFRLIMSEIFGKNDILKIRPLRISSQTIAALFIGGSLFWLLMVRGLYPGGGGDYFTHYFYYYLEVIRNHGLAPNDVWYHYYYSKGAGLYFLGILLTDPEAPQIVTFVCVSVAALSLFSIAERVAPRSLWPTFCTVLYLLYNLVPLDGSGGGEFQKSHEETTALVVIAMWAICMYNLNPSKWGRITFIALAFLLVGSGIITQPIAVFFAFLLFIFSSLSLFKKEMSSVWYYLFLAALSSMTVVGIFLLNYFVTGLATDQAINLTWKFANLERLDKWGVLPNVIWVAWIRDNYAQLIEPWGWTTFKELAQFMRLDFFFIAVLSSCLAFIIYFISRQSKIEKERDVISILKTIMLTIGVFGIISLVAGRSQPVSFYRFCSFFVPLIILFTTVSWGLVLAVLKKDADPDNLIATVFPVLFLFAVLITWPNWAHNVYQITKHARRFMLGKYSLEQAYSHQSAGFSFGGINPGTFNAMRQLPPHTRVWSTNVDSYCMVPDCVVESVISFKLSAQLNTILNTSPEKAKMQLQKEKLNYFLFSNASRLLDLLPYSQLFNPTVITNYFGIQWTDGTTYLLTWKDSAKYPLSKQFLTAYQDRLNEQENNWFIFSKAVPEANKMMQSLMASPHPWNPPEFSWQSKKIREKSK